MIEYSDYPQGYLHSEVEFQKNSALHSRLADKINSWRQMLPEYLLTGAAGIALRTTLKHTLPLIGMQGLGLTLAATLTTSAAIAAIREYGRQRPTLEVEAGNNWLKTELAKIKAVDKGKIGKAALKGVVAGSVGLASGWAIFEIASVLSEGSGFNPESTVLHTLPPETPTPTSIISSEIPSENLGPTSSTTTLSSPKELPIESPTLDLTSLPETVSLSPGSTIWETVASNLSRALGRQATNGEILAVAKEVAKQSNARVPEWQIEGSYLHTELPDGFKLWFNEPVRQIITSLRNH